MNSYFIGVLLGEAGKKYDYQRARRWTKSRSKDVNIFDFWQVFLPINISNSHWAFGIVNIKDIMKPPVQYFDSFFLHPVAQNAWTQGIMRWINDEHVRVFGSRFPIRMPQTTSISSIPQQSNTCDCGIFSLTTAEYKIRGFSEEEFDYSQKAMQFIRTKIAINLLRNLILDEDGSASNALNLLSESESESESESGFESESVSESSVDFNSQSRKATSNMIV